MDKTNPINKHKNKHITTTHINTLPAYTNKSNYNQHKPNNSQTQRKHRWNTQNNTNTVTTNNNIQQYINLDLFMIITHSKNRQTQHQHKQTTNKHTQHIKQQHTDQNTNGTLIIKIISKQSDKQNITQITHGKKHKPKQQHTHTTTRTHT